MTSCASSDSLFAPSVRRTRVLDTARWGLLALLIAVLPLARRLPERSSWENGWVEEIQIAILLIGFLCAAWA
jgi:hypothetical protein